MKYLKLLNILLVFIYNLKEGSAIRCKEDDNQLWSYNGRTNGPSAWGESYPDCYGRRQSPIDIKVADVKKNSTLKHLEMNNYDEYLHKAEIINNGHTVMITPKDNVNRTISINGKTYGLYQLHFHWGSHYDAGSEHLFNSKGYALEAHFVHVRNKSLAVVGVLYQEAHANNTGFKAISEVIPQIKYKEDKTQLRSPINLSKLLPRLPLHIYRYNGSLTTPGCTEGVVWSVAQDIMRIGTHQLNELRSLFTVTHDQQDHAGCHLQDNYRPVQPLNGRNVTLST